MQFSTLLLQALAITAASANVLVQRQRDCQGLYSQCIAAGTPEVACQCDLATCSGEDNARTRDFCANATATIIRSTASATSGSSTLIVGTPGSQPSGQPPITAPEGSLALGATCSDTKQCAGGAQCYGTTAGTIRTCGSFNAACSSDAQCATNTCSNGICSGFKATTLSSVARSSSSTASIITGTAGSQPSGQPPVTAAAGSLKLGEICSDSRQCANGADCYGTTAFTIRTCGSFNAACSSDAQCATNTCNNGICSGFKSLVSSSASSTASTSASIITGTAGSQPSGQPPVTAPEGSLKLGEICSDSRQCANGAECWGSNAGIIRRCGNFNASCKKDEQCANDLTCNNGLCNGLPKSVWSTTTATPVSTTAAPVPTTAVQACPRKVVTVTIYE